VRALIRRMAAENRLWGAPRIHGELLKLGIAVSERTVSRYLADIRVAPSQTWRTFVANHFGQLAFSPVTLWGAVDEENGVDVSGVPLRPASALGEQSCVSDQWSVVHWPLPHHRTSVDGRIARAHVQHRTREHPSSGKDPLAQAVPFDLNACPHRLHSSGVSIRLSAPVNSSGPFRVRTLDASGTSWSSLRQITSSASSEARDVLPSTAEHVCV